MQMAAGGENADGRWPNPETGWPGPMLADQSGGAKPAAARQEIVPLSTPLMKFTRPVM